MRTHHSSLFGESVKLWTLDSPLLWSKTLTRSWEVSAHLPETRNNIQC